MDTKKAVNFLQNIIFNDVLTWEEKKRVHDDIHEVTTLIMTQQELIAKFSSEGDEYQKKLTIKQKGELAVGIATLELIEYRITPKDNEKDKDNIERVFHKDDCKYITRIINLLKGLNIKEGENGS